MHIVIPIVIGLTLVLGIVINAPVSHNVYAQRLSGVGNNGGSPTKVAISNTRLGSDLVPRCQDEGGKPCTEPIPTHNQNPFPGIGLHNQITFKWIHLFPGQCLDVPPIHNHCHKGP
jgi:hypothetical protein